MALTVIDGPFCKFDPYTRDKASAAVLYARFAGAGTQAQVLTARAQVLRRPDLLVRAKTTDNTAASVVASLSDEGVTFPEDTYRRIRLRSIAKTDNDSWIQVWEQYVWGNDGTTPKLVGTPRLINAIGEINGTVVQYGDIAAQATYSQDTATAVAANSTAGASLGNNSTNTVTLTHPIARATPKRYWVNVSADVATNTEQLHGAIVAATSTTASIFLADLATPSADGFDDAGTITAYGFIVPPPSVALVMNSNEVEIHAGHDATDDVYHRIEAWIGRAEFEPVIAD